MPLFVVNAKMVIISAIKSSKVDSKKKKFHSHEKTTMYGNMKLSQIDDRRDYVFLVSTYVYKRKSDLRKELASIIYDTNGPLALTKSRLLQLGGKSIIYNIKR